MWFTRAASSPRVLLHALTHRAGAGTLAVMSIASERPRSILVPGMIIPRHVHAQAYATVVLEGSYQEAGECGRWCVRAGDVLLHAPFSAHCDRAPARGAHVLNLPVAPPARSACGRIDDPDRIVRLAERDPREAAAALMAGWRPGDGGMADPPDVLARVLSGAGRPGVEDWARANHISRATAFRWFRSTYGVGPTRYRTEARARLAWRMIVDDAAGLAEIAAAAGYADQAHMSRAVKAFTGRSPGAWRTPRLQPSFKTRSRRA
jgi:AraC-like DNA-binding protein